VRTKIKTVGDLAATSPKHQEALKAGPDHYRLWERNVADRFKSMPDEEVKSELKKTSHPFAVCFEHWIGDFNMGSGIRNANAFNAKEVFYIGDHKWDRRSAVGVYNYTEVQWIPTIEDFKKLKEKYRIIGIDNIPGKSFSIRHMNWPSNTLMVFGEEGTGLTPAMQELCEMIVEIPMYGSVRSLNCGVASGIVMYDFTEKFEKHIWGNDE
jgi:tRNA G18 (ribose-2'-O)-methylase SpoU